MFGTLRKALRREKGAVIVLVALALAGVVGAAGLVTDAGHMYIERQRLTAIADAAALSGAQELPSHPERAVEAARQYVAKNGIDPETALVRISDENKRIGVILSAPVSMGFVRVFGIAEVSVSSRVKAALGNLNAVYGGVPLGVARADWKLGDLVRLKVSPADGTVSPGNYQALVLGRRGASGYEESLTYGYDGWIYADEWLETEPGNMASPTVRAVNYRISQDPTATYETVSRTSPRLLTVPILEDFAVNGRGEVHVVGFAVFFVESAANTGLDRGGISGRFIRTVVKGKMSDTAPDYGAHAVKLIE